MRSINFATLLASTVHDDKNLLGAAMEGVEWLQATRETMDGEQVAELNKIGKTLSQINHDLTQLLFLYKLEKQQYRLDLRQASVLEFIEMQMAYLETMYRDRGLDIVIEVPQDLISYFDEMLLGIAFRNAVINALKYTKSLLSIKVYPEGQDLMLVVCDDGPGFPASLLDTFGQTAHTNGNLAGTGLGLYFCLQVASLHTLKARVGQIGLKNLNVQGKTVGAEFQIRLPQPSAL